MLPRPHWIESVQRSGSYVHVSFDERYRFKMWPASYFPYIGDGYRLRFHTVYVGWEGRGEWQPVRLLLKVEGDLSAFDSSDAFDQTS